MFAIGQAADQSGVKIETIRYYEREGIVQKPDRSAAGRRLYTRDGIAKLRLVKRCRDLGFPMPIIRAFLSLTVEQDRSCGEVQAMAEDHLVTINAKIESLVRLRSSLTSLSNSCDNNSASCPMLDALMGDQASEPL